MRALSLYIYELLAASSVSSLVVRRQLDFRGLRDGARRQRALSFRELELRVMSSRAAGRERSMAPHRTRSRIVQRRSSRASMTTDVEVAPASCGGLRKTDWLRSACGFIATRAGYSRDAIGHRVGWVYARRGVGRRRGDAESEKNGTAVMNTRVTHARSKVESKSKVYPVRTKIRSRSGP